MALTRFARRRLANSISTIILLFSKALRIYINLDALSRVELLVWWPFLVAQDTCLLLLLRSLADSAPAVVDGFAGVLLVLASIAASFYLYTGSELQWRNLMVASDPGSWKMMLSGLTMLIMTSVALLVVAFLCQPVCYAYTEVTYSKVRKLISRFRTTRVEEGSEKTETPNAEAAETTSRSTELSHRLISTVVLWQIACTVLQFWTSLSTNLSHSLPILIFTHVFHLEPAHHVYLNDKTAITEPLLFPWLPDSPQDGFLDWFTSEDHYNAEEDVLRASSRDLKLLPALESVDLKQLSIRNVLLITMESTRKDVFPINPNGSVAHSIANTFGNEKMPQKVRERLFSLTPFAQYLTGQSEDGRWPARGRINAHQAFTASTYTLKSMIGTICGISPLAADFNAEFLHHIYQPCLPHIMGVLNSLNATRKWKSKFMQSTTLEYDSQDKLMPQLGFQDIIGKKYLKEQHEMPPVNLADVNYYGMPEEALEGYIRHAFATARKKNENLFLTHLTSTTHHGFGLPKTTKYTPLSGSSKGKILSEYLNAVGYVDGWLGRIMTILQEEGAFNETLIIAVGDHGLALAEFGHFTAYGDPHISTLHVPLVISLPGLPNIDIHDTVTSLQILPTILDLLIETDSLSEEQAEAGRDLLHNSEGHSLLRIPPAYDAGHWNFHVTNPGGMSVSVHDSRHPHWRLAVPLVVGEPWRFVDLARDPWDLTRIRAMNREMLARRASLFNITLPLEWLAEAKNVTEWWVQENHRRWRYYT